MCANHTPNLDNDNDNQDAWIDAVLLMATVSKWINLGGGMFHLDHPQMPSLVTVIVSLKTQASTLLQLGWLHSCLPSTKRHALSPLPIIYSSLPGGKMIKNPPAMQRSRFDPWLGKNPWRREWLPTPVILPKEFHGERSLANCSPWSRKKLDTTERLILSLSTEGWKHLPWATWLHLLIQSHHCPSDGYQVRHT